jgi:DNA helicase-2/ATP-dependent DNA helicase PcrA
VLRGYPDPDSEASAVAAAIAARRVPGRGFAGIAVLARTNARLLAIASALSELGVPWRLRDRRALADQPEVRELLDALPASAPAAMLLDEVADRHGGVATALAEFRGRSPAGTVAAFAAWLDASGFTVDHGTPGGVDLATFHRAKGLEWRAVWVTGLETIGPTAEDSRLLYVAMTRAEEELAVSWAGSRPPVAATLDAALAPLAAMPPAPEQRRRFGELAGMLA